MTSRLGLAVMTLAGCTASAPPAGETVTSAPVETQATSAPTSSGAPSAAPMSLAGAWVSDSCGERKYPRHLTFQEGGTFSSRDLVSPCPPGAACVWSGIVDRSGSFKLEGTRVTLAVEGPDPAQGAPLATSLELGPDSLVEPSSGQPCAYRRR